MRGTIDDPNSLVQCGQGKVEVDGGGGALHRFSLETPAGCNVLQVLRCDVELCQLHPDFVLIAFSCPPGARL